MAEKEISLMCMSGHGLSGLQLVFTLLEGHVARTVRVSRSSHVTEQTAIRLGHKHGSRLKTRVKMHTEKDDVPKRHIILFSLFVFSRTDLILLI